MQLTTHFSISEFVNSTNFPSLVPRNTLEAQPYINYMTRVAEQLEIIRAYYKMSIIVTSGFRGPSLNLAVGSRAKSSQHLTGQAADFIIPGVTVDRIFSDIKSGKIKLTDCNKLILENVRGKSWIHLGIANKKTTKITYLKTIDGANYELV